MTQVFSIRIESKFSELHKLRSFIRQNLMKSNLESKEIHILELVSFEACANSIEHGYDSEPDNFIDVILQIINKKVTISIIDDGHELDFNNLPKLTINDIIYKGKKRGLGIPLINELMDDVEFLKTSDGRNKITLKRDFSTQKVKDN